MQDIIKKLVDIDEQAKAFGEETKKQKEEYEVQISEESKKIYEKYIDDAKAEVEAQKEKIESESKEKYEKTKALTQKQSEALKKKFDENADRWVDEIVADVLK